MLDSAVSTARARPFGRLLAILLFHPRRAVSAVAAATVAAVVIGLPTDVVPNPWFTRMTPVRTLDALAGLSGALTYFGPLQPVLGAGGVALGLWALRVRVRALAAGCPSGGATR